MSDRSAVRYFVNLNGVEHTLNVEPHSQGFSVMPDPALDSRLPVEPLWYRDGRAAFNVGNRVLELAWAERDTGTVHWMGRVYKIHTTTRRASRTAGSSDVHVGPSVVSASMPGKIVKVCVEPGATVHAQSPLLVIEAMKMENELLSPRPGIVQEILVKTGSTVERGAPLIRIA